MTDLKQCHAELVSASQQLRSRNKFGMTNTTNRFAFAISTK